MNIVKGDLIKLAKQGESDVIVHGCNCYCTMGAGIAKSIKSNFPQAYQADQQTVKGSADKLGTYSQATVEIQTGTLTIVNAYTQLHWRGKGVKANYDAIRKVFKAIGS